MARHGYCTYNHRFYSLRGYSHLQLPDCTDGIDLLCSFGYHTAGLAVAVRPFRPLQGKSAEEDPVRFPHLFDLPWRLHVCRRHIRYNQANRPSLRRRHDRECFRLRG